jgi:signal transduction histidine kinase
LFKEAVHANAGYADQFGVALSIVDDPGALTIVADRLRVSQVLANLLSNAVKFSHEGGTVELGARLEDAEITIFVTDHGIGIPDAFVDRIFGKFAQVDSSDARYRDGTGLGLSICKSIVEQLGGRIGFHTKLGQGTTFHVTLPRQSVESKDPSTLVA